MQFLWVQSVLKWQNEMGMQKHRSSPSGPRPVRHHLQRTSKKHEFLTPISDPLNSEAGLGHLSFTSSAVSLARSQVGEPLLEMLHPLGENRVL